MKQVAVQLEIMSIAPLVRTGESTFQGNENSNPVLGEKEVLQIENEIQISILFEQKNEAKILQCLQDSASL